MAVVSQAASNRKHISNTITSSLRTHCDRLEERVIERVFGGAPPPDLSIADLIIALADYLDGSTESFATAATKVLSEMAEDKAATTVLNKGLSEHRAEIISQRSLIDGTYGAGTAVQFGYAGETPNTESELIEASRTIEKKLREQDFPEPRRGRQPVDGNELADLLADLRQALEDAAKRDRIEARETQAGRSDRNSREADWNLDYKAIANIAVGLFQLAREEELAERVRPTARRRQGHPEDEDLVDEPQSPDEDVDVDVDEPVEA